MYLSEYRIAVVDGTPCSFCGALKGAACLKADDTIVGYVHDDRSVSFHNLARKTINIVFDYGPGPVSGRFVEVEDDSGRSLSVGKWKGPDGNGYWRLRITELP